MSTRKPRSGAFLVAAGILLSRISGLVRERVFAHYFGNSDAGDAFKAALKIPNFLQNLLGEGVLSASFIPVYARLLSEGRKDDARRLAGTVAAFLGLVVGALVLLGVIFTPALISIIAPGFEGAKQELTIQIVRILFPGIGLLVLSALCLGVLNSHGYFFLSYAAPVTLNLIVIVGLLATASHTPNAAQLAINLAWIQVIGCGVQFLVQVPSTFKILRGLPLHLKASYAPFQVVARNFGPVVVSRGVVQVSAYLDAVLASWLPTGAVSALAYAQILYTLPVSLFGMAVSASELPELSKARGDENTVKEFLRGRLDRGLRRIAFFVVPTSMVFIFLGDVAVGAIFQTGAFDRHATLLVWGVLAAATAGLTASTQGRLYASAFYALQDTRTPLRFALVRVFLTGALGWVFAFPLVKFLGIPEVWGTAGLTFAAGIAGYVEYRLLRRGLRSRLGDLGLQAKFIFQTWGSSAVAAALAWVVRGILPFHAPIPVAMIVFSVFGLVYLTLTTLSGLPEAQEITRRFRIRSN
ncbi:MAG: murein biosynthesis integral membrane protein MurJ [Bdellovibrionota bacterium]